MIATWTKLELEPSALQSTPALSTQAVSCPAADLHRGVGSNREGCHLLGHSSLACWRCPSPLWSMEQSRLEKVGCCDRRGPHSLVLPYECFAALIA